MSNPIPGKCKHCGQRVWWFKLPSGRFRPPYQDEGMTSFHNDHCTSLFAQKNAQVPPIPKPKANPLQIKPRDEDVKAMPAMRLKDLVGVASTLMASILKDVKHLQESRA